MTEQIFSVRDGEVMWRGHWLPTQNAVNLLANLQGQSWAEVLVEQLSEAIATVSEQEIEHA